MFVEIELAGLILHRQKPPLTRRFLVYFCSGAYKPHLASFFRCIGG
jgi:hypothetical protein